MLLIVVTCSLKIQLVFAYEHHTAALPVILISVDRTRRESRYLERSLVTYLLQYTKPGVACVCLKVFSARYEYYYLVTFWSTQWRSCLRHCHTSRKVTSSIPGGINGIFH